MKTRILKLASVLLSLCLLLSVGVIAAETDIVAPEEDTIMVDAALNIVETEDADSAETDDGLFGDLLRSPVNLDLSNALKSGLAFDEAGDFTILQLSDLADGSMPYPTMIKYIEQVVASVDPDLVVLTGDITSKLASTFGGTGTAINWVVGALKGKPFTITFGDEDALVAASKLSYLSKYANYSNFLGYHDEKTHSGVGDHNLFIFNNAEAAAEKDLSKVGYNLWFLDTNRDGLKPDQGIWYGGKEYHAIHEEAGYTIPSMMFTHVPLPQIKLALDNGEIPAYADGDGSDVVGQAPTTNGEIDMDFTDSIDMFQYMSDWGNVQAVVSGHDYLNQFVRSYSYLYKNEERTLDFIQTGGMGFTRKCEATRGARVINLHLENVATAPTEETLGIGEPPEVSIASTYTIDYFQFFDFVSEDISQKVYYYAGASWFLGKNASIIANFLGIFGVDKYNILTSVTQFFGDTFNFAFKMK